VEVTGGRVGDTEERRRSTAAKIVIGREEIDKFGDASLGEVLRRLPGVTTPGPAGRGGPPRMRGLGEGYMQPLIDGQRIPPGFSLESLTPEQIERIEILRAPTAETGARAIAGTINIITREGFRRRLNDLRVGFGLENGRRLARRELDPQRQRRQPHLQRLGLDASAATAATPAPPRPRDEDLASGALVRAQRETAETDNRRTGMNLSSRLSWRLGEGGDSISLMPMVFHTRADNRRSFALTQSLGPVPPLYDNGDSQLRKRLHQRPPGPDVAPAPGRSAAGAQRRGGCLALAQRQPAARSSSPPPAARRRAPSPTPRARARTR
jgi:iron complex outermembrane receptor protein